MSETLQKSVGRSVRSPEGEQFLRGEGCYAGDVRLSGALHLSFLRAEQAGVDFSIGDLAQASALPGVIAILRAGDVGPLGKMPVNPVLPMEQKPAFPILANGTVAAIGQPILAILATTAEIGADVAELIDIDYRPSDATQTVATVARNRWNDGDPQSAFARADHIVEVEITHPVLAPSPMETRSITVNYDKATHGLTIWQSTQTPHRSRSMLAELLGLDPARIRVIAPDVGGAFGMKASLYPEEILATWAALHLRRSVRWVASRSEDFLSATHGRGLHSKGRMAISAVGEILALEAEIEADLGYWLPNSALIPAWNAARILPSAYRIEALDIAVTARISPHPARGIYRGAGRPEANMLIERLIDRAARVLDQDPLQFRAQNLLGPQNLPHDTATGNQLDSGHYALALDHLATKGGYTAALAARDLRRDAGGLAGVGIAFFVEPSGEGWESARVTLNRDHAVVHSGSSGQGQRRKTTLAQIAADALGLAFDQITVHLGDTDTCPEGIGALASRSTAIGGSAVQAACQQVLARCKRGETAPITHELRYHNAGQAWGYGTYMAEVSIDRETGAITLHRLVAVDDAGVLINPALAKGQIFGGAAQGIGEALLEQVVFDADGQLLSGSFMDYAMPRAGDMPAMESHSLISPSPLNLIGAKGLGEAGTIAAPPAIMMAALDALAPLGVTDLDMPMTPCRVWQAINAAQKETRT